MKRILLAPCLLPGLVLAAPFDLLIQQRNIGDSSTFTRTVPLPAQNISSIFAIDQFTNLPALFRLSQPLGILNGELVVSLTWPEILNKPVFATVATSGDYNDLTNKPSGSQVNSDWSASSGSAEILNKPSLATVATSGSYADLFGAPLIPASQVNSDWASGSGVSQVLNKPSTLAGYGITDGYPLTGNPSSFLTGITSGQVTTALGFTPYNSTNPSSFITQAGARSAISLTTTGAAGAATYNISTGALNIPNYAPGTGTVTSVAAGSGLSGGAITTSGTISMPSTGTPGTYTNVTTDAQGRVTSGLNAAINDAPGRSLVTTTAATGFQISATRNAQVCYEGSISTTSSIGGPSAASVFLETADTNSTTPGDWTTKAAQTYSNNITLAIVLNQVQGNNWSICRVIPGGKFVRIRSGSVTGTASVIINAQQQEVLQ